MREEEAGEARHARRRLEAGLLRAGGRELLCDALVEATWYADLFHPWNGRGAEPPDRAAARLFILRRRLEPWRGLPCSAADPYLGGPPTR